MYHLDSLILSFRPLDTLASFETASKIGSTTAPSRYAIYHALDQEHQKHLICQRAENREARYNAGGVPGQRTTDIKKDSIPDLGEIVLKPNTAKRDFFGRVIDRGPAHSGDRAGSDGSILSSKSCAGSNDERKVWLSFHEGFSNAVRKPITLEELMKWF